MTAQQVEVPTRLTTAATHPSAITPEVTAPQEVYARRADCGRNAGAWRRIL